MYAKLLEIIAAKMYDDSQQCPLCLEWTTYEGEKCSCSSWTDDELNEYISCLAAS